MSTQKYKLKMGKMAAFIDRKKIYRKEDDMPMKKKDMPMRKEMAKYRRYA